ncbi:phage minor capsid protein [Lacrimispora defluvii]|uniref:Minor capsid protein n=1 Tax=Lacrimispora defluvii TaxID=2719233 RepID=A0ABX1VTA4_9FIRM|nr:phage minor capsid protein [Lacrimispora defluvii]NNJ31608.1 hypothetical protein [Lacrimispora defluvii]
MNEYDISAAFEAIEQELIASMIRNMNRHRAEELKEGYDWSMWQVEQLKALEKYKLQNQKKYSKQFKSINSQIGELIWQARQQGGMKQEAQILRAIKNGFKSYKPASATMQAEFFKLNTRKLEALIKATGNDMKKAETAVLRMANDQYRKAIFNAQVYANSGAGTYEKAVDMATKDMLSRGLNCVEYKNGARHALSDYADMAIRTASKRAYLQGEGEKRQEWGISTVIVGKRGNPCPKCLPFVGKVLIDDVWSGGKASDGPYPLMSAAIARGLYHPRCKDSHSTYFPGISTAEDTWTREELKSIEKSYKQEQDQQYNQRQADKFKRLAEYSLDESNKKAYDKKRQQWESQSEKEEIGFFKKIQTKKVTEEKVDYITNDFVPANSLQEAKEYAFKEFSVLIKGAEDIPLENVNSINRRFGQLIIENSHMKGFIQEFEFTDTLGEGAYAARVLTPGGDGRISRSIQFNQEEYKNIEVLSKKYSSLVKSGHFPKGTTYENIVDHEFAHAMADEMGLKMCHIDINGKFTADEWKNVRVAGKAFSKVRVEETAKKLHITAGKLQKKISGYAVSEHSEAFAEAFSSVHGTKPTKEALALMAEYDRIKKMYH